MRLISVYQLSLDEYRTYKVEDLGEYEKNIVNNELETPNMMEPVSGSSPLEGGSPLRFEV